MLHVLSNVKILVAMGIMTAGAGIKGGAAEAIDNYSHISAPEVLYIIATFVGTMGVAVGTILAAIIQIQKIYINCKEESRKQHNFKKQNRQAQ